MITPQKAGLCQCDCGETTLIAQKTRTSIGQRKGEHMAFVNGHNRRKKELYGGLDRALDHALTNDSQRSNLYLMKILRTISIAVFACLIFTAPAAADTLTVSASTIHPGETIPYAVSTSSLVYSYGVALTTEPKCQIPVNSTFITSKVDTGDSHGIPPWLQEGFSGSFEPHYYTALGTYRLCFYKGTAHTNYTQEIPSAEASFEVTPVPLPPPPPAPVITPPAPGLVSVASVPVVSPKATKHSKLVKALKGCKKRYKGKRHHKQLVKCEKQAHKAYR